ncbi:hypothetical protein M2140_000095 [Clostridiales Family XIII bacterium PM5-7]
MMWAQNYEFEIKQNRGYYEVYHGKRLISTADNYHEAEEDVRDYESQIESYIRTGKMTDYRTAVFFRM